MEEEWFPDPRQDVHVPITNAIERKDFVGARKLVKKRMEKSSDTIYPVSFSPFHSGAKIDAALILSYRQVLVCRT